MRQTAPQSKIDMDMDGHMKYDFIFVTDQQTWELPFPNKPLNGLTSNLMSAFLIGPPSSD